MTKNTKPKVIVAKEIMYNFKLIKYAIIIGLVTLPIFYFGIFNVSKYDNFDTSKVVIKSYRGGYTIYGLPKGLAEYFSYVGNPMGMDVEVYSAIQRRKDDLTPKCFLFTLYTFLISAGLMILIRYLSKGINWVKITSQEDNK